MAWARGLLVFVAGLLLGRYLLPAALPFVLGFCLALILQPLADLLERRGLERSLATFVAVVGFLFGGFWLMTFALWSIWSEAERFLHDLPHYYQVAQEASLAFGERLGIVGPGRLPDQYWQEPVREAFSVTSVLLRQTAASLAHLPEFALAIVMAVLAAYFLTRDGRQIEGALVSSLPFRWRPLAEGLVRALHRATGGYLRAQGILVATTACLVSLGLLLVGSRYALLLGMAAGLLDLVPALGAAGILLPWSVYLLLTGHMAFALRLLVLLAVIGVIREVVETKVVGGQVGLHPLAALMAMYFGVRWFGAWGIALGPILVATTWAAMLPDTDRA